MDFHAWLRIGRSARGPALTLIAALALALLPGASAGAAGTLGVAAWGANLSRQLGDGSISASSALPVPVQDLAGVSAVAAGGAHSLALLNDGSVASWGENESGQLGNGATALGRLPATVPGLSGVTAIAAGAHHSLALLANGTVMAWGANESGQLGNGSTRESDVPVLVKGLTGVRAIAAGAEHSLALLANGTVMAWGANESGQLGNGKTAASTLPVAVKGLAGVSAVAGGTSHSLALLANGTLMAWGDDSYDQLGNESVEEASDVPVPVLGISGATAIACGANHNLALLGSGAVMAWGANARGELGEGTTSLRQEAPAPVTGLGAVSAVAAGATRSVALLANGTVMSWGDGSFGALGSGAASGLSAKPVAVKGLGRVSGVSVGGMHDLSFGEPLPEVQALSPSAGASTGATSVTLSGAHLLGATAVRFGTKAATSFTVASDSTITAIAPAGSAAVNVSVTTPAGVSPVRAASRYSYLPAPVISRVTPNSAPAGGGSVVTITGTGLTGATSVSFGGQPASSFTVDSGTSITAVAPPGGAGTVDVAVTTAIATSPLSSRDHFKYVPTVEALAPAEGPAGGGTQVTVTGSGFATAAGATTIKFGTRRSLGVSCGSSTTCTATAPAHEAGAVQVLVTVNKLTSAPGGLYTYR